MRLKLGTIVVFFFLCLVAALGRSHGDKAGTGQAAEATMSEEMTTAAKSAAASGCDAELWNHVYHKTRLRVVESCIAVTGTVRHIKRESDGDDHIWLAVDPEFSKLLNERNKTAGGNSLILEPVCQGPVTLAEAHAACRDFHSPVSVPAAGERVRVVGSYVLDTESGWMEIHPVSSIEVRR
jgi:hypothetical protein